VILIISY